MEIEDHITGRTKKDRSVNIPNSATVENKREFCITSSRPSMALNPLTHSSPANETYPKINDGIVSGHLKEIVKVKQGKNVECGGEFSLNFSSPHSVNEKDNWNMELASENITKICRDMK